MNLIERAISIEGVFNTMNGVNGSSWQKELVNNFRTINPELNEDLDFCFEVLAGKHKLGFTVLRTINHIHKFELYQSTIKEFVQWMKAMTSTDKTEVTIEYVCQMIPHEIQTFMIKLLNREYRLGYSNKANMVTDKHCMLAMTYPNGINTAKAYFIQEKLNGNRCISYFEDGKWQFISRSQKPMHLSFDMTGFDTNRVYDGEAMRRDKMGNRDFAKTSGAINSKFGDKSDLMYFIYDILDDQMSYRDRARELMALKGHISPNIVILKLLDKVTVYPNPEYNSKVDYWLDFIVGKGGEGIILRDPDATYYHSKNSGDRRPCLLKYKQVKTCDLRIVGWNEGKDKYTGMIGSFICENDEQTVRVSVAGIDDATRMSDPRTWIGKIIEVLYFDISKSDSKDVFSLQFPRFKQVRDDKTETSMF